MVRHLRQLGAIVGADDQVLSNNTILVPVATA